MRCRSFGNKALPYVTGLSALVFLGLGAAFVAPYWLFDGASFGVSCLLGTLAIRRWREAGDAFYSKATCCVAGISILVDVGFMVAAAVLWNSVRFINALMSTMPPCMESGGVLSLLQLFYVKTCFTDGGLN